ncbi:MAG TPA: hypothetical protein VK279_04680 [Solirubrobacteraceae bacterium]|nr:hypothetical protein [Solirubrobacteraceae bacterium]
MPSLPRGSARGLPSKIPWAMLLELGRWVYFHGRTAYARLNEHERQELPRLLRQSRGRPGNLTDRERSELRRIVTKAVGLHS